MMLKYEQIAEKFEGMRASDVLSREKDAIASILSPYIRDGSFRDPKVFGSVAKGTDNESSDIDILLSKGENYTPRRHLSLIGDFADFGFPIQISTRDELYFTPDKEIDLCLP